MRRLLKIRPEIKKPCSNTKSLFHMTDAKCNCYGGETKISLILTLI